MGLRNVFLNEYRRTVGIEYLGWGEYIGISKLCLGTKCVNILVLVCYLGNQLVSPMAVEILANETMGTNEL